MKNTDSNTETWTTILRSKSHWFDIDIREFWKYRELVALFVKRDFVAYYKQTILGPLWFFIQPIFTMVVFTLVFSRIAQIPTSGIPPQLFYLSGIVCWNYFAECLNKTSNTFISNAAIFGKVYFPRLVVPASIVISNLITFAIQFALFLLILGYFSIFRQLEINIGATIFIIPILVVQMGILGLGMGIIVSSLTTRYRDLSLAVNFGVQLWMMATPIVYPLEQVALKRPELLWISQINPMTPIVETFRNAFFNSGGIDLNLYIYGWCITLSVLLIGVFLFNRVEKSFMDTI